MKLILCFFLLFSLHAKILKYEVTGSIKKSHKLKDACEKMGHKHLLLVEVTDISTIDCMGSKLKVLDFCKTISLTDPLYIRGYTHSGKAICQKGEEVVLTVICDARDKKYCKDARLGCLELKKSFAVNHHLIHQSLLYQKKFGKVLSCYFSSQKI